ncbi:MAG: tRNA epoxyqueuosine(34) reductase QueG [Lysobacterales bacterium]
MPAPDTNSSSALDYPQLLANIRGWSQQLGFQQLGVSGIDLAEDEQRLIEWLGRGEHGEMSYMQRHGTLRSRPAGLVPGTLRVLSLRMDYFPHDAADAWSVIEQPELAYVSRYAVGRDYHKLVRGRIAKLARLIEREVGPFGHRAFVDSAPVLEKPLARNAGLGWIGKHTNLINTRAGSWFFLGELYVDLPLPLDAPATDHCGTCRRCIDICPTGAIVAPYRLDARLCISYLTIELEGSIPESLRPLVGNRIYGCDDCQLVCPWNKFAQPTREGDFAVRHGLDSAGLANLFAWDESTFLARTEGSAIRRLGHTRWLRNIAVALGNAAPSPAARSALLTRREDSLPLVREHVAWALDQYRS